MKTAFIVLLWLSWFWLSAQKLDSVKIEKLISTKFSGIDLSKLWVSPDTDFSQVGFIGLNYERFRIHFATVVKSKSNPSVYIVKGKTKVKNNICDFEGNLMIESVNEYSYDADIFNRDTLRLAYIKGSYLFKENPTQTHTGTFKGAFHIDIYIDRYYNIHYDDLMDVADNYSNNHFDGSWTSYDGKINNICNWGDCRVDSCGDLDWGVGDFYVNPKYLKNGWEGSNWRYTIDAMEAYIKNKKLSQWWKP